MFAGTSKVFRYIAYFRVSRRKTLRAAYWAYAIIFEGRSVRGLSFLGVRSYVLSRSNGYGVVPLKHKGSFYLPRYAMLMEFTFENTRCVIRSYTQVLVSPLTDEI